MREGEKIGEGERMEGKAREKKRKGRKAIEDSIRPVAHMTYTVLVET